MKGRGNQDAGGRKVKLGAWDGRVWLAVGGGVGPDWGVVMMMQARDLQGILEAR